MISGPPGFTLARTKASIDLAELSAITARRKRPERVSRYFAPCVVDVDQTDIPFRAGDGFFEPRSAGKILVGGAVEVIDRSTGRPKPRRAFEKIAVGIDHRVPKLLRQQPGRFVGDASGGATERKTHLQQSVLLK
jgi:hypothetical protein